MSEPTKEVKLLILEQEIAIQSNTRYQQEIRHRISKKLGALDEAKAIEAELLKIEQRLDELEVIKKELNAPSP